MTGQLSVPLHHVEEVGDIAVLPPKPESAFYCEACDWRGDRIDLATDHEQKAHDGVETCGWEAVEPVQHPEYERYLRECEAEGAIAARFETWQRNALDQVSAPSAPYTIPRTAQKEAGQSP